MLSTRLHVFGIVIALSLAACERDDPTLVQGYVEGEFVYVATPASGQLQVLSVEKGTEVEADAPLFALDSTSETAARDEAARKVKQAQANLADAREGQRPTELEALDAQLEQARAALVLSEREFERQSKLAKADVIAKRDLDTARSQRDQDRQRVTQLGATLETAKLGSRSEQIAAAEQAVLAQEAALAGAEWSLAQKSQRAPSAALVNDTLYRLGDWVNAGVPVVVLLPPANVKVRAFVSQTLVGAIQLGDIAQVHVDGVARPFPGRVSFIAPRVEFTPPVIYSQKMREKFVFMIELSFPPDIARKLHPGQPVDVRFTPTPHD